MLNPPPPAHADRPSPDDVLLAVAVADRLAGDASLDGAEIVVDVHNRVVILDGTVRSAYMRLVASDLAWRTTGVFDVSNRLHVDVL